MYCVRRGAGRTWMWAETTAFRNPGKAGRAISRGCDGPRCAGNKSSALRAVLVGKYNICPYAGVGHVRGGHELHLWVSSTHAMWVMLIRFFYERMNSAAVRSVVWCQIIQIILYTADKLSRKKQGRPERPREGATGR
jgi:hypothetical protein